MSMVRIHKEDGELYRRIELVRDVVGDFQVAGKTECSLKPKIVRSD